MFKNLGLNRVLSFVKKKNNRVLSKYLIFQNFVISLIQMCDYIFELVHHHIYIDDIIDLEIKCVTDWACGPLHKEVHFLKPSSTAQTGRGPTSTIQVSGPNSLRIVTSDIEMINIHCILWFFNHFPTTIDGVPMTLVQCQRLYKHF
jgi:hypothetical protein